MSGISGSRRLKGGPGVCVEWFGTVEFYSLDFQEEEEEEETRAQVWLRASQQEFHQVLGQGEEGKQCGSPMVQGSLLSGSTCNILTTHGTTKKNVGKYKNEETMPTVRRF
jgi:hypothetical protein